MMNRLKSLTLIGLLAVSGAAFAQIETPQATGFVGLKAGYAKPTGLNGRLGYGADVGMMFPNGVTGLLYFLSSVSTQDDYQTTISHYGLGLDYSLLPLLGWNGLHAGVRVGMGSSNVNAQNGAPAPDNGNHSDFSAGLNLGYDWMLASAFSIGGEATVLWNFGTPGVSTLYGLVNLRYWY